MLKSLYVGALVFLLGACSHIPVPEVVLKPSRAEKELIELTEKYKNENVALAMKMAQLDTLFKQNLDANVSLGSAHASAGLDTLIASGNTDKFTEAAKAALEVTVTALPEPSLKHYKEATETQRKLLSDQAAEIEKGKKEIEARKLEALTAKEEQRKAEEAKATLAAAQETKRIEFEEEAKRLAAEAIKQTTEAAQARATADAYKVEKAQSRKDLERLIIYILMGVGIACGAISFLVKGPGQLFNPIAAVGTAGCVGLAVGLAFLPTWAIFSCLALLFGMIVWAVVNQFKNYKDIAVASVGGIQEHKNKSEKKFDAGVATNLKEWTAGKPKLEKNIDKLAKELNVK